MRKFDGQQLVVATHNKGKLEEIQDYVESEASVYEELEVLKDFTKLWED